MKKQYYYYAITILAGYLLFLLLQLPASVAVRVAQQLAPEAAIAVQQTGGSAWKGSAVGVSAGKVTLTNLNWEIRALPLMLGRMEYQVEASGNTLSLSGTIGTGLFSGPAFEELNGWVSSGLITTLAQIPFVKTGGDFELGLEQLVMKNGFPAKVQGEILWREARISSPYQIALGNILLLPKMEKEKLVITISNQDGAARIDGTFVLDPQGQYQIQGTITPSPDMDRNLVSMLNSIGRRGRDGSVAVRYAGKL